MKPPSALLSALVAGVLLSAAPQAGDCSGELARYGDLLGALCRGDDVAAELRACAERLCASCDRCDARNVAEFYAALEPDARRQGVVEQQKWYALWTEVGEAGRAGTAGQAWAEQRERIVRDLRALADRVTAQPDFVPAARALSLIARLEVERVEEDARLAADERERLIESADADARAAIALFDRAGQVTTRLEPEWILARLLAAHGERDEAHAGFQHVLTQAEHVGNDDFRENALRGLAVLARAAGDVRGEESALGQIATFRDPHRNWPLARDWAARLIHDDHAEQAIEFLGDHKPGEDAHVIDRVEWDLLMGSASLILDDTAAARSHYERVARGPAPAFALVGLASLALREGHSAEAIALLDDEQRLQSLLPQTRARALALRGEARLAEDDPRRAARDLAAALEITEANEAATSMPGRSSIAGAAGSVVGERLGLETIALLAEAEARLGESLEAARVIADAQAHSMRHLNDNGARIPITVQGITDWAAHFELGFVTWVVGGDFTVVARVSTDSEGVAHAQCQRIELGRSSLQDAARRLREAALGSDTARMTQLANDIAGALFPAPIAAGLRDAGRAGHDVLQRPRLLLVAHGLEELPFELLPVAELCGRDDVCVLALPGLPERSPGETPQAASLSHWVLLGAPVDAQGVAALPGAREELAELADMHRDAQSANGPAFDRAHLEQALRQNSCVHIATHLLPICDRDPGAFAASSLLLSGGAHLCASEVAAIAPRCPLVVLSACASGAGSRVDAEGLQGMARAFLDSGTRNLLVTTWPVEDGAAAAFAAAFHRALAGDSSPARAADSARRELQSAGFGPADWAAFRLLGRD